MFPSNPNYMTTVPQRYRRTDIRVCSNKLTSSALQLFSSQSLGGPMMSVGGPESLDCTDGNLWTFVDAGPGTTG